MSLLSKIEEGDEAAAPPPAGALLAVDIGSVYTRAVLFDVAEGMYRLVGRAQAPTTSAPPWNNLLEGLYDALLNLQTITGRALITPKYQLIMPDQGDFFGVDGFAATASGGRPIRVVLVGLVDDISVESGRRAAESSYMSLVEVLHLGDRRPITAQLEAILDAEADLILITGGTDGGAAASLRAQVRKTAAALAAMEYGDRPTVLYAGNSALQQEVINLGERVGFPVITAPNVRPALDKESFAGLQETLTDLYNQEKARTTGGFDEIREWTAGQIMPTGLAFSQAVRLLARLEGTNLLGVDLGSSAAIVAASLAGSHNASVFADIGLGHALRAAMEHIKPEQIGRWVTEPHQPDDLLDCIYNKWLRPQSVPANLWELEVEYGLAREMLRLAFNQASQGWRTLPRQGAPAIDAVLLAGAALAQPPHPAWTALSLLDALPLTGLVRVQLDPYALAPALGVLAARYPAAVVQVLETGSFAELASLIIPTGRPRAAEVAVHGVLRPQNGPEQPFEVRGGELLRLPLALGQQAELTLHTRDLRLRLPSRLQVRGSLLGVVIDARGRPWRLPSGQAERAETLIRWRTALMQGA